MKTKQLLLTCLLAIVGSMAGQKAFAYNAKIGGIYYNFSGSEATVTYQNYDGSSYSSDYSGAIVIPKTVTYNGKTYRVTSIGDYAFSFCSGLTSITIPNSVTSIGSVVFLECSGLTSITIPNSVTSIGSNAFRDCSGLTSITIPNSVTSIEVMAFYGCSGLTSITIPNSVTSIGSYAFSDCSGLTSITIPNSVTSIGRYAFQGCPELTDVWCYAEDVPKADGAFSNYSATLHVPAGSLNAYRTTSPWSGFGTIVAIEEPSPVIAFADANVKALCVAKWDTNGDGELSEKEAAAVTSLGNVLQGKTNINSFNELQYFTGLTSIGEKAFYGCTSLTSITIPGSVTSIGNNAFSGCSSLTSITIPNSVTSIGNYTFRDCSSLTSITIPGSVTSIGNYAFSGCNNLTSITIPSSVKSIGNYAFRDCTSLTSITIPGSVTSIGYNAFSGCSSLTSITIPNSVTSIGSSAFRNCTSLTSITIPNSVTRIGGYAFYGCTSLTSITIPNSVTGIGDYVFSRCSSLTSITIPNSVTSIGDYVFSRCSSLTSIQVETGNTTYDSRDNCNAIIETATNALIAGCKDTTIPGSVTSIGGSAFSDCSGLTSITIPNSVTSIGDWAFSYCSGLTEVWCYAENVPTATNNAFSNYSATLHVPAASLQTYRTTAPWSSFGTIVAIEEPSPVIAFADANVKALCVANWDTDGDGELSEAEAAAVTDLGQVFTSAFGNKDITSFNELQYFTGLTTIGSHAFYGGSNLTFITIPNSVTSIGDFAFARCSSLTSITIPNSVTSIGSNAFYNCSKLTTINIPNSVTSIGSSAFYNCSSLTSINIPNSVTSIGSNAFEGCSSLTSINIPNSVTSIGASAFYQCTGLTSITIGSGVTSIGNNAFYGCSVLTFVNIPNSVNSIGESAFSGCKALTSINIPNSVTSIGKNAFYNCRGLTSINIPSSVTSLGEWVFGDCISLTTATIGCSTIGDNAFVYCEGLTSATIKKSVTSIGRAIFNQCYSLTSIIVESGNTVYDSRNNCNAIIESATNTLIAGCQSTVIPNSVTSIGELAFYQQFRLNSIEIPDGVTSIGEDSFGGCTNLTSVIIPSSVTSIGEDAFWACSKLIDVWCYAENVPATNSTAFRSSSGNSSCVGSATLHVPTASLNAYSTTEPWSSFGTIVAIDNTPVINFADAGVKALCVDNWDTNGDGELSEEEAAVVTSLGNVFREKNITSFNELQYFTGLTSIGKDAFNGCTGLTSITIPNSVTSIGNTAFSGCSGLTSITIPNSVTNIGECAFNNCRSLTSITIPNSVKSIGYGAFGGCSGLTAITIPNSVTSIGRSAFYNCSGLTSITIPESVIYIGDSAFGGCYFKTEFFVNNSSLTTDNNWGATLYDEETSDGLLIKNTIVVKCREWAVSVSIPSGVTGIGSSAFYNCTSLTSITIPNSVTSIGYGAFRSCTSLTSITIPNSVTSIGYGAFEDCTSLTSITIPNSVTSIGDWAFSNTAWLNNQPNGLVYAGKFAYSYKGTMPQGTEIVIKDGTLGIIGSAFSGCNSLTSINIPNSVTSIGGSAFSGCTSLTSITIPNSVTSIGYQAFYGCSSLTSITILEGVKEIGTEAFRNCSSLTTIVIPKGVTNIGSYAFVNCTGLESVTILEGGDVIGSWVFAGCKSLKSVTVNEGVTFLGSNAFSECNNVTIKLPNSLREIGGQLFGNNSTGNTIIIGNGIKNVNNAFIFSSNLTIYIYALQRPSSLYHNFYMTNNCKTYVPYGCSGFYRSGANIEGGSYWSGEIIEMPYPSLSIDNSRVATYCSEKAMDFSGLANVEAYVATGFSPSTQTLLLTRVMQVPAGEGVIVFGEPGTYDVPECESDMVFGNLLKGLVLPQKLSPVDNDDRRVFTLASGEEGTCFYPLDDQQWYAAGTAYLQLPENAITSDVKQIKFEIEESISTEVGKPTLNSDSTVEIIYDINGQRRPSMNKGINILRMSDGTTRKVLVK